MLMIENWNPELCDQWGHWRGLSGDYLPFPRTGTTEPSVAARKQH